ncbi:MAG: FAD-dependent oxidoreductase [Rickettsiales bacterium]|jgi:thioredoxin reductase (NADPH)|nr:FAD-dependent oxidoreductase [Rickettsiales bacterium]
MIYDSVILGSGPAGLATALYLSRAGRSVLTLLGIPGGQMSEIAEIENYPGAPGRVTGGELAEIMQNQAVAFGAQFKPGLAESVLPTGDNYTIKTNTGDVIEARSVIVATGASPRRLGVPGEAEFSGRGVSYCATCDGNFYKNRVVMVVGGGNSALSEALHLSHIAAKVIISYRQGGFFRAEKVLIDRIAAAPNIEVEFNSEVVEICGDQMGVNSVIMSSRGLTPGSRQINLDGIFIAIGHTPNTQMLSSDLPRDATGHLITLPNRTRIADTKIFVAGDVRSESPKQVVIAAGQGAQAAMECSELL